ncbi:MAG: rRNA methyltransferase [Thiomonas sp. 20-64-5]|nr:MAG: rRNA methyltransferase [Thiomonas sp. 20-64-5]
MSSAKKNKFSKAWLQDHLNDPYVKMAQREGYRARAAYKLKEIDETEGLLRPGQIIVDLGSTPGSWSQYARNRLMRHGVLQGTIFALDLLPMEPVPDVHFLQGDFREDAVVNALEALLGGRKVDVVLSDMAPNLTGIPSADAARIEHLSELALDFARRWLQPQGAMVIKTFHGSYYSQSVKEFKQVFQQVKAVKPQASRDKSAETFILARVLKKTVG